MMIFGRNIKIFMDGVAIAAAKSCEISINVDTHNVATPADTEWLRLKAERYEWTVQVSTLVTEIRTRFNLGQMVTLTMAVCDANGMTTDRMTGSAYLKKSEITAQLGNLVQGGFTYQGIGVLQPYIPPPYDAEIDYLQSSGTQYIDTGLKLNNNSYVELAVNSMSNSLNVFGSRVGVNSKNIMISVGGNDNGFSIDFNNSSYSPYRAIVTSNTNPQTKVKLVASKNVRGVYKYPDSTSIVVNNTVCPDVFTCDTNALLLNASGSTYYTAGFVGYLYYCKINDGDTPLLDLIPVRVGQVGYMYDRVSGTLFENDGTGAFILGPDKT